MQQSSEPISIDKELAVRIKDRLLLLERKYISEFNGIEVYCHLCRGISIDQLPAWISTLESSQPATAQLADVILRRNGQEATLTFVKALLPPRSMTLNNQSCQKLKTIMQQLFNA